MHTVSVNQVTTDGAAGECRHLFVYALNIKGHSTFTQSGSGKIWSTAPSEYVLAFLVGGALTVAISHFETSGYPLISRLAALFPVFTRLSCLFIGNHTGDKAVSQHALFVLLGTMIAWLPYMFVIYHFAPKVGATKAVLLGAL